MLDHEMISGSNRIAQSKDTRGYAISDIGADISCVKSRGAAVYAYIGGFIESYYMRHIFLR
jgi:hypothetical protein